jgi:Putative GTPase activating protein for Arf
MPSSVAASSTLLLHPKSHQQQQQQQQKHNIMKEPVAHTIKTTLDFDLLEMASKEIEGMRKAKARHCKRHRSETTTSQTSSSYTTTAAAATTTQSATTAAAATIRIPPPLYHSLPTACMRLIQNTPGNQTCIDCGAARNPMWAAVSYGALLCLQCSGHHRSLGVHVSCVRSLTMDEWSLEHIVAMLEGGNEQCRRFFARHHLTPECLPLSPPSSSSSSSSSTAVSPTSSCNSSSTGSCSSSSGSDEDCDGVALKSSSSAATTTTTTTTPSSRFTPQNVTRLRYKTKAALFYRQQMTIHVRRLLDEQSGPYRGRDFSRQQQIQRQQQQQTRSSSSSSSNNNNNRSTVK